jgi:hypothetical protein
MRRFIFINALSGILLTLLFFNSYAQELSTPAPSPQGTITQVVGISEISVSYSRPGVKGRKIFGELVPYNELWRTGANRSTTIKFSDDVSIEGHKIAAGEYALFTIPNRNEWEIIISNSIGSGSYDYKKEEDVARFKVKSLTVPHQTERFTIDIADMTNSTANITLMWEETAVTFKIACDTDAKIMSQIEKIMKNPPSDDADIYFQSASYYFENGKDLHKSLNWVNKSLQINPDAFWIVRLKSQIQAKMGDYKGAIATAKVGIDKAKKAENKEYVKFNQVAISEWEKQK